MCKSSKKQVQNECGCNFSDEPKCCCIERPESEINRKQIKKCINSLREKADFIEKKISN